MDRENPQDLLLKDRRATGEVCQYRRLELTVVIPALRRAGDHTCKLSTRPAVVLRQPLS